MSQPQQMTIQQAIDLAVQLYQNGRLVDAESVCRQIIAAQPNHAEALHLLGILSHKAGRSDAAIELLCAAIGANPRDAEFHYNLGQILAAQSPPRLSEAAACFRQAAALRPQFAAAYYALGTTLAKLGSNYAHQAVIAFENAVQVQADFWLARLDLANALQAIGKLDDAIRILQETIKLRPDYANAYYNLGNMFVAQTRNQEAAEAFQKAVELKSDFVEARVNLGFALRETGRVDEAIDTLKQALALRPNAFQAWYHLGLAYTQREHLGKLPLAIEAFEKATAGGIDSFDAQNNLAVALARHGQFERAAEIYEKHLQQNPSNANAKYNLSQIRLVQGDLQRGWQLYESRWMVGDLGKVKLNLDCPRWEGEDLTGKRILLYSEQGYGDAIQFARYASLVKQRGAAAVILQVLRPNLRLMKSIEGVTKVITDGDIMPMIDLHCPLLSLPLRFNTTLQTVPASVPYIHADASLSAPWRQRIAELKDGKSINVGLVWAGRSEHSFDRNRSIALEMYRPFANVDSVRFFSLQKDDGSAQARSAPSEFGMIDWTKEFTDFADTAALIDNLDLVITVDTAVAHLAGAMGKPVWVLLPFAPDWRWMLEREDSPWYPSMRLFRQPNAGNWQVPIERIVEALRSFRPIR